MRHPVRVGVVGAGSMGSNHMRAYSSLKGATLTAVVDTDPGRAAEVASRYDCLALGSAEDMLEHVDAVSIATPSAEHAELGCFFLDNGINCLIEKPLATSEADCLALIASAERSGASLLVGHTERFNPAVRQLQEILAEGHDIYAIEAHRMSALSSRVTDIDVVLDLMVHDLDIVLSLAGEPASTLTARGVIRARSPWADYVTALLTFPRGCLASVTASRVTQNQVRSLHVTTDKRFFSLDYSAQELLIYRQGRVGGVGTVLEDDPRYVLDVGTERVFLRRVEPLLEELSHFIDLVNGQAKPKVPGKDALESLRLVWDIQRQVELDVAPG